MISLAWLLYGAACIATLLTWSGDAGADPGHDVITLLLVAAVLAAIQHRVTDSAKARRERADKIHHLTPSDDWPTDDR